MKLLITSDAYPVERLAGKRGGQASWAHEGSWKWLKQLQKCRPASKLRFRLIFAGTCTSGLIITNRRMETCFPARWLRFDKVVNATIRREEQVSLLRWILNERERTFGSGERRESAGWTGENES
ncbi:MAG: hypothetical protein ACTS4V_00895 [Candidatus Hodgkinia cicadicola]